MISQNKIPRKSRGVSPVIATVILVAVAITVAVAVSYWMAGISSQYTSFEKVEIQSGVCTLDTSGDYWSIVIKLKNSGTKAATLTDVFVNDRKAGLVAAAPTGGGDTIDAYLDDDGATPPLAIPLQIASGDTGSIEIWIGTGGFLSSGTTVNIKIHSAGGMDYIKLLQLT